LKLSVNLMHSFAPSPLSAPYSNQSALPVFAEVRSPRAMGWMFRLVAIIFLLTPFLLLLVPWQQSVTGRGRVIAYDPTERPQTVTARVGGQIVKWHVKEGDRVEEGADLVDIEDNDPELSFRLSEQRKILQERYRESKEELTQQKRVVDRQKAALDASLKAADFGVNAQEQTVKSREQALTAGQTLLVREEKEYDIIAEVVRKGNRPEIDLIRQRAARDRALADVERLKAELDNGKAGTSERQSQRIQAEATGQRLIAEAERDFNRIQQSMYNIERELHEIDNRIERFEARHLKAPCAGTVLRIEANAAQGGSYVKEGDPLAIIVPEVKGRMVVELWVDGVDIPLIQRDPDGRYPHVRLQFEGWPAVQFVGWPSVARGTFGGRIILVDSTDNGRGQFRVLVGPDKLFADDEDWPDQLHLRQGNQAIGWVFLNQVTIGWEVWRRLNGFPPTVAPPSEAKGDDKEK
jgi:biotin carboxyl carrier protein